MNSHSDDTGNCCFPDSLLEEYVLGRLDQERCAGLDQHIRRCRACKARLEQTRNDTSDLIKLLEAGATEPAEPCLDGEMLAMYLDRALSEYDRSQVENHLSACRACQSELVRVYRALQQVRHGHVPIAVETEPGETQNAPADPAHSTGAAETERPSAAAPTVRPVKRVVLGVAVSAALGVAALVGAMVATGRAVLPLQFLALGCVSVLFVEYLAARPTLAPTRSRFARTILAVLSAILFGLGCVSPKGTGWYLTGAAGCFWVWLLGRVQVAASPGVKRQGLPAQPDVGTTMPGGDHPAAEHAEKRKQRYSSHSS